MKIKLLFLLLLFPSLLCAQNHPYAQRREKVFEQIGENLAIIKNSGRDYTLQMDVNWNYYYLCGDQTAGAILVLNGKDKTTTLYRDSPRSAYNPDPPKGMEYKKLSELSQVGNQLFRTQTLWLDFSAMIDLTELGRGVSMVQEIKNISPMIHGMRKIKDAHEMELLTHAIQTTAAGLNEVFRAAEPGMNEQDFELILKYCFAKNNCEHLGFGIQAASGPNATSVHYGNNNRDTKKGDMMVFDVGARYGFYSADVSRSFPVSGTFTKEQAEIYQLVLDAQKTAISMMQPGASISEASAQAVEVLNQGLAKLGLITDLSSDWQKRFWIQHGFFHHIGLVVHDVGGFPNKLEPGMILTMEPGLYFPEGYLDRAGGGRRGGADQSEMDEFLKKVKPVFEKYVNIGVRIEDDVYITETGNEVISRDVPKEIAAIEKLMKEKSFFNHQ